MDFSRSLKNIKLSLDINDTSSDELIMHIFSKCRIWLEFVCNVNELTPELISAAEDITVIKYNTLGSEALSSERIGPISMTYDSLPSYIREIIKLHKKVHF